MKIGILTYLETLNYGAVLQAYALSRKLTLLGYDAETIDYWLSSTNYHIRPALEIDIDRKSLKWIRTIRYFVRHAKRGDNAIPDYIRRKRTQHFISRYVHHSPRVYKKQDDLKDLSNIYDCIIVGSDQIWNPTYDNELFLLDDISGVRKIAYAPSLGVQEFPSEKKDIYTHALEKFHRISCREKSGSLILEQLLGKSVPWVCDPVMLLPKEQWEKLTGFGKRNKDYIFCYWLGTVDSLMELLQSIPSEKKVFLCCGHWMWDQLTTLPKNVTRCISAGPLEFLKLIANAKSIISDSFHAMLFSIIFRKPFSVYLSFDVFRKPMNARMIDFAQRFNIEECLLSDCMYSPQRSFDFDKVWEKLSMWCEESESILLKSLT